ncbi:MAG: hypothetical protein NUV55_07030 [Sulfuricaulis sp.]|uniref:hypothetical protein n=1 Tax=Sulfuricaulis sp. TaxID=2003553 RepID=UPI0025FF81DA|nr:hypothetical protein [Sulfuricaulis sp.]MCR4346939.1 hypothetical protein [Sulfuricaulis sp.]
MYFVRTVITVILAISSCGCSTFAGDKLLGLVSLDENRDKDQVIHKAEGRVERLLDHLDVSQDIRQRYTSLNLLGIVRPGTHNAPDHIAQRLVLISGNGELKNVAGSIIVATGSLKIQSSANNVIVCNGDLSIGDDSGLSGAGSYSSLLVSKGRTNLSRGNGTKIYALGGTTITYGHYVQTFGTKSD